MRADYSMRRKRRGLRSKVDFLMAGMVLREALSGILSYNLIVTIFLLESSAFSVVKVSF